MNPQDELAHYWTPIYNIFDPFKPILGAEELKAWFVQRPDSPLSAILTHFRPGRSQERILLVGHPSSGKSSELTRLAFQLGEDGYNYAVLQIDLSRNANVERINQVEVLFLLGVAAYKMADKAKLKPDKERFDALINSLATLVRTYTENDQFEVDVKSLLSGLVCFAAGLLGGPAGAATVLGAAETFRDFTFISGTNIETIRKTEVEPKINEILVCTNAILDDVQAKAKKNIILLVDGLDRVRNIELAELLFTRNRFLADVNCRMLYTVPTFMDYQPQFAPVWQMFKMIPFPNVRLHPRDNPAGRDEKGYHAMRQVVWQRLTSLGYSPEHTITSDALDTLISASGGLMRDLIRLMREATVQAELAGQRQIDQSVAQEVVYDLRRDYQAKLTPRYRSVLDKVRQTHQRTDDAECNELLYGNFILSYSNHDIWYDVHSVLD